MSSSNSASINNLNNGVSLVCDDIYRGLWVEKSELLINTYKNKKFNHASDYERDSILLRIECRFGEKIGKAHSDLKNEGDNCMKNLETLYDEKFKENTKRQKGLNNLS